MIRNTVAVFALFLSPVALGWAADEFVRVVEDGPRLFGAASAYVQPEGAEGGSVLVVTAGVDGSGELANGIRVLGDGWVWEDAETVSGEAPQVFLPGSVAVASDLLVFGGRTETTVEPLDPFLRIAMEQNGLLFSARVTQESGTGAPPSPRFGITPVRNEGTGLIYIPGGTTATEVSDEFHTLDPLTNVWSQKRDMPEPRTGYAAVSLDDEILVFGGFDGAGPTDTVFCYDIPTDTWSPLSPTGDVMPPLVGLRGAALDEDNAWVGGGVGTDGTVSDRAFLFNLLGLSFSETEPIPAGGRTTFVAEPVPLSETSGFKSQVVLHGGDQGGTITGDTWFYVSLVPLRGDGGGTGETGFYVPAAAAIEGVGAYFRSTHVFFNPRSVPREFNVEYYSRSNQTTHDAHLRLQANRQVVFDDLIREAWSLHNDEVGAIWAIWADGEPFNRDDLIWATTIIATQDQKSGAEYGQSFPAVSPEDAIFGGGTGYIFSTESPDIYRVNIGGVGTASATTVARVTAEKPLGNPLAPPITVELDHGESFQINNIYNRFNLTNDDANAVISIAVESGALIPYGSVLDGNGSYSGTSDPTTIEPVLRPGSNEVYLLEIGSITGQGGSRFNGSVSILNFNRGPAAVRADMFLRGSPGIATSATLTVPGGEVLGFPDFAKDVLGVEGDVGTIRFSAESGGIAVTGREYSVEFDGSGDLIGTAGQAMPGLTDADLLPPGVTCHGIGLRQGDGERSHIAFFNPGTSDVTADVSLFNGANGASEGQGSFTIPGQQLVQINNIIREINPDHDGDSKRIEVTVNGPVFGHVFRVNPWNDPVTFDFFCRQ